MEDQIKEFIDRYKKQRADHLDKQYIFRRNKENKGLTDLDLLGQDEKFYADYLLDAKGISKLRNASITPIQWVSAILALKNRSEMINSKIDFFNYMHTLLAIALPLFILAGQAIDKANWILAAICFGFVVWLFKLRSELRFELSTARELVNLFEQLSKSAI